MYLKLLIFTNLVPSKKRGSQAVLAALISLFSSPGFANPVGAADQDMDESHKAYGLNTGEKKNREINESLKEATDLIEAYEKPDKNRKSFGYKKFHIIFDHIGPIEFVFTKGPDRQNPSLRSRLQNTDSEIPRLSPESVQMFLRKAASFKNSMIHTTDSKQDEIFEKAQRIVMELMTLATRPETYRDYQLARLYRNDQYRVLKSMKTGFFHLPSEIFRFTTAIVIVRLASCFGPSMWESMSFKPKAKNTDPACLNELGEMLVDPVFYTGFSGFVLASRGATPVMLNALRKIDPKYGPVSQATARLVVPQFAMAVGFIADHIIKTLLQNQDVQQCLLSLFKGGKGLDESHSFGTVIDENGEEFQVYDYYRSVGGTPCRRAGQYISSDQFLKKELGVGITSLISAALSLSALQATVSKGLYLASRLGTGVASIANQITIVLSLTGPVGLIIGTGRMVVFLFLAELITPYATSFYHLNFMEPKLDNKADALAREYEGFSGSENKLGELTDRFEQALRKTRVEKRKRARQRGRTKSFKRRCSEHYNGHRENGAEPLCTAIPMITEIMSFHDYSRAWRSEKILGDFNMAVSRWKKKLTGFFDNYSSTREQIRYLTRSREIYLTGESEGLESIREDLFEFAVRILKEKEGLSSDDEIEDVLNNIRDEVVRQETEFGYKSPVLDFQPIEPPYPHPRIMVFNTFRTVFDLNFEFVLNREGSYYFGIHGPGNEPEPEEVDSLIGRIIEFIDLSPLIILNHSRPRDEILPYNVQEDLKALGFPPHLTHYPFSTESLRWLLTSEVEEDRVYGLILFKNWAPFMYGPKIFSTQFFPNPGDFLIDGKPQRLMGFGREEQYPLYKEIVEALNYHDPVFKHEFIYLNGATFSRLGEMEKGENHARWSQSLYGMETSELYAYSLTQLICGPERKRDLSTGTQGLAMNFRFPKLLEGNICDNLYQPVYNHDENQSHPLVTRSQFTSPGTLHLGLHQAYIQAPKNRSNPLLFDTEARAQKWWDENILPENIERLKNIKQGYAEMVAETFTPHLTEREPKEAGSSWERFQRNVLPWVDDGTGQKAGNYTSAESLIVSIINELGHYHRAILSFVDPSQRPEMDEKLRGLTHCFRKLLKSIPGKKYTETKKQCQEDPGDVITNITYQNGSINQEQIERILRMDDSQLLGLGTGERGKLIRNRILLELSGTLDSLYNEIFMYNQVVNDLFDFNLEKNGVNP